MMNQYQNETAQIHAPAALIAKTKAAVRQEEERISREQGSQIPVSVPQVSYEDYVSYHHNKKHSVRKWTYPLSVAAAVVILLSVSMAMKGILPGGYTGNGPAADGAMEAAEAPAAEDAACAEEITEASDSDAPAAGAVEEMNGKEADSMTQEPTDGMAQAEAEVMEDTGKTMSEAPAADYAQEDTRGGMVKEEATEKAAGKFRNPHSGRVKIEAVDEKPDFYDNPDAEDIVYEGLTFRVMQEEEEWAAYVETEEGTAYVICGEAEELEEFLEEAYEGLEKIS